jgi:hypothetical protein
MEKRKTAAIVLGIISLVIIFFTVVLPELRFRGTQTLSFKNCTVHFKYEGPGLVTDIYSASQNKLALCLCNSYQQKPDTVVANRIIKIYQQYGNHYSYDSVRINNNIDSIIKHKSVVLDTLILID